MEEAHKLKEAGNELYKQRNFGDALQKYIQASKLQPHDPVFYSNISAVLYEIGKYKESLETINHSLTLFSPSSNPSLFSRLLLRQAKCLFYSNQLDECSKVLSSLSSLEKESKEVRCMADSSHTSKYACDFPSLSIFRKQTDTQSPEYFTIGHDNMTSCFEGQITQEQENSLNPANTKEEHTTLLLQLQKDAPFRIRIEDASQTGPFSFLFGGVGDARHLFGSLLDLECVDWPATRQRFQFTMVDIKEPAIARDLVMFYIFRHISKFTPEQQQKDINAIELLTLAHYTYLSTTMPSYLYKRLLEIIKELISDLQNNSLPHWIVIDKVSIEMILVYLEDWLDVDTDTKQMLKFNNPDLEDMLQSQVFGGQNFEHKPEVEDPIEELAKQAEKMSDEEILTLPIPGVTSVEKRKNLRAILANDKHKSFLRQSAILLPGLVTENDIFKHILTLLPPNALLSRHTELLELMLDYPFYRELANVKETRTKTKKSLFKAAQRHVAKYFKPNPTFWDEWFMESVERHYELAISPFTAVGSLCDIPMRQPTNPTRIYDYMALLFSRISSVVGQIEAKPGVVVLEWVVDDVFNTCLDVKTKREDRLQRGLPVEYDRIYLSNVPDYTGGNLPIAIYCAPLLKSVPHAHVGYRVLLNTSHFKSLEDNAKTYTLLPTLADQEKFLGMKHIHGDLWGSDYPKWAVVSPKHLATQEELTTWLHKIFLHMAVPPARPKLVKHRIDHPLNLQAFVALLNRLAEIGYPHHWLAAVLDSLLDGTISTKARPAPNSMNDNFNITKISTTPFIAELEYAIARNLKYMPFRPVTPLPPVFRTVTLNITIFPRDDIKAPILCLLIGPSSEINANVCLSFQNMRNLIVDPTPETQSVLSSLSVISSLSWDSEESELRFCISLSRLEQMMKDDFSAILVRVDTFISMAFPIKIRDIVKKL